MARHKGNTRNTTVNTASTVKRATVNTSGTPKKTSVTAAGALEPLKRDLGALQLELDKLNSELAQVQTDLARVRPRFQEYVAKLGTTTTPRSQLERQLSVLQEFAQSPEDREKSCVSDMMKEDRALVLKAIRRVQQQLKAV
jgi:chromosome segregation ATPase